MHAQILFSFELTVACIVRPGYFASLYFWIDLAATFSMLLDITALMDIVFHQSSLAGTDPLSRGNQNKAWLPTLLPLGGAVLLSHACMHAFSQHLPLQAVRSHSKVKLLGQVLVRMKQILRVTRIFRLMRLVKLFQQYLVRAKTSTWSLHEACTCEVFGCCGLPPRANHAPAWLTTGMRLLHRSTGRT